MKTPRSPGFLLFIPAKKIQRDPSHRPLSLLDRGHFWRLKVPKTWWMLLYQLQDERRIISLSLFEEEGLRSAAPPDKLISPMWEWRRRGGRVLPGTKLPWTTSLYAHQLSSSLGVRGWAAKRKPKERVRVHITCQCQTGNGTRIRWGKKRQQQQNDSQKKTKKKTKSQLPEVQDKSFIHKMIQLSKQYLVALRKRRNDKSRRAECWPLQWVEFSMSPEGIHSPVTGFKPIAPNGMAGSERRTPPITFDCDNTTVGFHFGLHRSRIISPVIR